MVYWAPVTTAIPDALRATHTACPQHGDCSLTSDFDQFKTRLGQAYF